MTVISGFKSQLANQLPLERRGAPRRSHRSSRVRTLALPGMLFFALLAQLWVRVEILQAGYRAEEQRSVAIARDI